MDKEKLRRVREVLEDIFKKNEDELKKVGVVVSTGNATYDMLDAVMKLKIIDFEDGEQADLDKMMWERYAQMYGMEKDWYGKTFKNDGKEYKIVGINPNKRSKPVIVDVNGKRYLVDERTIKMMMEMQK